VRTLTRRGSRTVDRVRAEHDGDLRHHRLRLRQELVSLWTEFELDRLHALHRSAHMTDRLGTTAIATATSAVGRRANFRRRPYSDIARRHATKLHRSGWEGRHGNLQAEGGAYVFRRPRLDFVLKNLVGAVALGAFALLSLGGAHVGVPEALRWAYVVAAPGTKELKAGTGPFKAPNGAMLTGAQIDARDLRANDWAPSQHPPAPAIILGPSRKNGPAPCGECHAPAGTGLVNIPDLAGLPADYIVEQLHAFRSGERRSALPNRLAVKVMVDVAKASTDAEMREAATYFARTPRRARIKVIEADVAPATAIERFNWFYASGKGVQRLNGRIIEVPESVEGTLMYDPRLLQLAYAPKGSVARGGALVHSGGGAGQPCASCHGPDLKGLGVAPPLAGRDPSYLARALWDIKSGARHGASVTLMQRPAGGLDPAQIVDVTAYLASLKP
jgi:cytochrome c553